MRGQISLDFILAITIALVAAGAILAVSGQIAQTQAQSSARQQLDGIGNGLAAIISYSAILNDAGSGDASVEYSIPALLVAGKANPEKCIISIDTITGTEPCTISINTITGTIDLSYDLIDLEADTTTPVNVTKNFVNPAGMIIYPTNAEFEGSIRITKS